MITEEALKEYARQFVIEKLTNFYNLEGDISWLIDVYYIQEFEFGMKMFMEGYGYRDRLTPSA